MDSEIQIPVLRLGSKRLNWASCWSYIILPQHKCVCIIRCQCFITLGIKFRQYWFHLRPCLYLTGQLFPAITDTLGLNEVKEINSPSNTCYVSCLEHSFSNTYLGLSSIWLKCVLNCCLIRGLSQLPNLKIPPLPYFQHCEAVTLTRGLSLPYARWRQIPGCLSAVSLCRTHHCTRGLVLLQHSPGSSTAGLHTAGSSVNSSWMNGWILNEHTISICQALSQHRDISGSDEHASFPPLRKKKKKKICHWRRHMQSGGRVLWA